MTFKSLNDLTPVYLKQCFQYSFDVHGYNMVYDMSSPRYIDLGSLFKVDKKNGRCC